MSSWESLVDEAALATVLPPEYARYRRPIAGALAHFLDGLPPDHQSAVLHDQAALPWTASTAERLARLAQSCPALHKLGQILARDPRLSPELRGHLQGLESLPPAVPIEAIERLLRDEVGPLERYDIRLEPPAIAEASVAVVVPFRGEGPGVFKVLKPGIEDRLDQELALLESVGGYLDERCDDFGIPHLDYRGVFEQIRIKLLQEIRLDDEQRHLARARAFYDNDPAIHIPALLGPCGRRVTAMERVFGSKITEGSGPEGRKWAGLLADALIARPIFAKSGGAIFHGDPHAGNIFRGDDGRLAILDWSLAGVLGGWECSTIVQVMLAAVALDAGRVAALLDVLGEWRGTDAKALGEVVRDRLRELRRGRFPGFSWLLGLLDDAATRARLRPSSDLLLFRKSLHTLQGVVADLAGNDGPIEGAILGRFARRMAAEWPLRWASWPRSRAFDTHVSNADLLQLACEAPIAAARFWLEEGRDLAELLSPSAKAPAS
ncbi:MAG: AarF/UbiB family protein [Isosphaeraceae bacterium]